MTPEPIETVALAVRDLAIATNGQELSLIDQFSIATNEYIAETEAALESAKSFTSEVEYSEAAFQVADQLQDDLKRKIKEWEDKRTPITRPLNKLVTLLVAKLGNDNLQEAVALYQARNRAYTREQRVIAEEAQRRAEALARQEREKLEAEARKRETDAAKLKTKAAQDRAMQDAANLRQTAQMVPETFAMSAPAPQTVASNVAQVWKGEITDKAAFLQWLISRPEWFTVLDFKQAELNRMAKQFSDTLNIPGVRFSQEDSYRSKSRR